MRFKTDTSDLAIALQAYVAAGASTRQVAQLLKLYMGVVGLAILARSTFLVALAWSAPAILAKLGP